MSNNGSLFLNRDLLFIFCIYILGCSTYFPVCIMSDVTSNSLVTDSETTKPSYQNETQEINLEERAVKNMLREQGLYYDMETILDDIERNKLKTGLMDLLSVHNRSSWLSKRRNEYQAKDEIKKKKRMVFINIETIYSSKREMITKALARRMRGRHLTSPPKYMGDLRVILGHGQSRRLYYSLTKYSTASHIQRMLNTQAVVLERYWLHHASFVISKCFNSTELPPLGHPIYKWPQDLLAPDVLFFINATKDVGPNTGFTQPYTEFTEKLITVFRRVDGVKVVELHPSPYYQSIVRYIVDYLKEHFSDHPDIMVPNLTPGHYGLNRQPPIRNKR